MIVSAVNARIPLVALALVLLAALAVLVVTLRGGPDTRAAAEAATAPGERTPVELVALSPEPQPDAAAQAAKSASPTEEPSPADAARTEIEGVPSRKRAPERREGLLRGRLVPASGRAVVLVGRGGRLPLDSQAVAWPLEPDGKPPPPVRTLGVGADGRFEARDLEPGPLRLLVQSDGSARLERDDLWLLAGDVLDLGDVALEPARIVTVDVRTATGAPAEDARLHLVPRHFSGPVRALGPPSCSPLGEVEAAGLLKNVHLSRGTSLLLAVAPGHPPAWLEVRGEEVAMGERLSIELPPAFEVRGELIDLDGVGLERHEVGALSLRAPHVPFDSARAAGVPTAALLAWRTTLADGARRFALDGLEHGESLRLRALAGGGMERPDAFAPDVLATAGDTEVELFFRRGAELAFELVDARTGEDVAPFLARIDEPVAGARQTLAQRTFPGARARWTNLRPRRAAADPLYADLPESEELRLEIEAEGFAGSAGASFRLRTGEPVDLGKVAIDAHAPLHLQVVAADGAPLEGATCELVPVGRARDPQTVARARTDGRGRARPAPLLDGAHDLFVRASGRAPWRERAPAFSTASEPFEVRLAPGGTLRVHVVDAEREPVRAEVWRRRAGAELDEPLAEEYERALVDADGWASFHDLEPGMVSVAARALPRADLDLPADHASMTWVSVAVVAGGTSEIEAPADLVLPLEVRAHLDGDPLSHALVRLSPDPSAFSTPYLDAARLAPWPTALCDERGRCVFEGLPPGAYALRVEHPDVPGFGRAVAVVEPGRTVVRIDARGGLVAGRVLDPQGEPVDGGVAIAWALPGHWFDGLEIEPWTTLRDLAPQPLVFSQYEADESGTFWLSAPPGVELVLTGIDPRQQRAGDYYVEGVRAGETLELVWRDGEAEEIGLYVWPSERLHVRAVLPQGGGGPRSLGVVALCLDHPWGRGVVAQALDGDELELDDVPAGRWKACLVELASDHLVLSASPWVEVDALPPDEPLFLRWSGR